MKTKFRRLAERFIEPSRINDSLLYRYYLRAFYSDHYCQKLAEKRLIAHLLERVGSTLVFDVGANAGHKAEVFLTSCQHVVCFEPDPTAARQLRRRFARKPGITVIAKGVSDQHGVAQFIRKGEGSPLNTFSPKWADYQTDVSNKGQDNILNVEMTTLDFAIKEFGIPNYIKIDVEGFELQVLRGLSTKIRLISFEANLPLFEEETIQCIQMLSSLGRSPRFNWLASDSGSFVSPDWLSPEEMVTVVKRNGEGCLEIFREYVDE